MSFKNLAKKDAFAQFSYPGLEGFIVNLKHLNKDEANRVGDYCSIKKYNPRTKAYDYDFDVEKYKDYMAEHIIVDWKGLTYEKLNKMVVLDMNELKTAGVQMSDTVEPTFENKKELLEMSIDFSNWVSDMIREAQNFAELQKKAEFENLKETGNGKTTKD